MELVIVILMFVILTGVVIFILRAVLLSWSSQETRSGIGISLDRGIEEMAQDLRAAKRVSVVNSDEVRFTHDLTNYYIYYLYNASDSYPSSFNQSLYQLKKTVLTGGISGTFIYGLGNIIVSDVLPPPTSDLSYSANVVTFDISIKRIDETIRTRTQIRPRNL